MGIFKRIVRKFSPKKKESKEATPSKQYSKPIGPTQKSSEGKKDLSQVPSSLGGTQKTGLPDIGGAKVSSGGGGSGSSSSSSSSKYQGPVQPGVDTKSFRETGKSVQTMSINPNKVPSQVSQSKKNRTSRTIGRVGL